MDFKINKQRANKASDTARRVIEYSHGGMMPDADMVCVVLAVKKDMEAKSAEYIFRFEVKENKLYAGQVIVNEDMSVVKILEVIE